MIVCKGSSVYKIIAWRISVNIFRQRLFQKSHAHQTIETHYNVHGHACCALQIPQSKIMHTLIIAVHVLEKTKHNAKCLNPSGCCGASQRKTKMKVVVCIFAKRHFSEILNSYVFGHKRYSTKQGCLETFRHKNSIWDTVRVRGQGLEVGANLGLVEESRVCSSLPSDPDLCPSFSNHPELMMAA